MKKRWLWIVALVSALALMLGIAGCGNTEYNVTTQVVGNGTLVASVEKVPAGGSVTLTATPAEHYTLKSLTVNGEVVQAEDGTYVVEKVSADVAAVATFKGDDVTVTLDYCRTGVADATVTAEYGAVYDLPAPTEFDEGYEFDGWYTAEVGGEKLAADARVEKLEAHTLYARYKLKTYTVTFDYGSETGTESTRSVTHGTAIGALPSASVTRTVTLWKNGTAFVDSTYAVTGDVTLHAAYLTAELSVSGSTALITGLEGHNVEAELSYTLELDGEPFDNAGNVVTLTYDHADALEITGNTVKAAHESDYAAVTLQCGTVMLDNVVFTARDYTGWTQITDAQGFKNIANDLTKNYVITEDIDFGNEKLSAIGSHSVPFSGTLDGLGHKLQNATWPDGWNNGLIARVTGTVRDIAFTGFYLGTGLYPENGLFGAVGGIVSDSEDVVKASTIENIYLDIDVRAGTGTGVGDGEGGLLVGKMQEGHVKNCVVNVHSSTNYTLSDDMAIIGHVYNYIASIENVFAVSSIPYRTTDFGGGLVARQINANDIYEKIASNSGLFGYTAELVNVLDTSLLDPAVWSWEGNVLKFHGEDVELPVTPEWAVKPIEDIVTEEEGVIPEDPYMLNFVVLHNGVETTDYPQATVTSSEESVCTVEWNDLNECWLIRFHDFGESEITVTVEGASAKFKVRVVADSWTHITDTAGFNAIANDLAGKYVLDADIDFGGEMLDAFSASGNNFTGILDGKGHAVKNGRWNSGWNHGVFGALSGTVQNIAFLGFKLTASTYFECGLVGNLKPGGLLKNVLLEIDVTTRTNQTDAVAGLLVGQITGGRAENCVVSVKSTSGATIDAKMGVFGKFMTWGDRIENVFVVSSLEFATTTFGNGMTAQEAVAGVYSGAATNSGVYSSVAELKAALDEDALDSEVWTWEGDVLKFHETTALGA